MDSLASQPRWYLAHCKPRQDARALEHLERQGFECYRPVRQVERLRNGHRHIASEALFPRYLFIRLDCVDDNWYPIRSTRGVHQIVRCKERPLPVRDEIVEGIRSRLAGHVDHEPFFKTGERVQITEGAFSHVEAFFLARDGDERVVLLLNIMQTDQVLPFPLRAVRKAG